MFNEMTLAAACAILIVFLSGAVLRFTVAAGRYLAPFMRMKKLARSKGVVAAPDLRGLALIRDLHIRIATDESAQLLSRAEASAAGFVSGLRLVLATLVPLVCFLAYVKYMSDQ